MREANQFIASLVRGTIPVHVKMHDKMDIPTVCRLLWIRPGEVVRMILDGRLRRVGSYAQADGYLSVLVDRKEVKANIARASAPGMTVSTFASSVGLKTSQVHRLIRAGHLPSTVAPNPVRRAVQPYLSAADRAAFDARFATVRTLSLEMSDTWQQLRRRLEVAELQAFSPDGIDFGPVYERRDVEAALMCRWRRQDASET